MTLVRIFSRRLPAWFRVGLTGAQTDLASPAHASRVGRITDTTYRHYGASYQRNLCPADETFNRMTITRMDNMSSVTVGGVRMSFGVNEVTGSSVLFHGLGGGCAVDFVLEVLK